MNNGVSKRGRTRYEETRYMCSTKEFNERIENIVKIHRIINSDLDDVEKSKRLVEMVNNIEFFKKKYGILLRNGELDPRLNNVRPYLYNINHLFEEFERLEKTDYIEGFNYLHENKDYFDNYEYAKKVINLYINSEYSYDLNSFLEKLNLNQKEFKYCVSIIEELDIELYKLFMDKQKNSTKDRDTIISKTLSDLSNGIKTGELSDGTKFDKLEFIKRVPFKNGCSGLFMKNISNFLIKNNPQDKEIIMKYIYDNDMNAASYFKPLLINQIYNVKTTVNGREITKEDNDIIFTYIEINEIPCIWNSYKLVREKLIQGEVTPELVEEQKRNNKPILVKNLKMMVKQ